MLPEDYRLIRPIYKGPFLYFAVALPGCRTTSCIAPICDVLRTQIGLTEIERLVRRMGKSKGLGSFEDRFKQFVVGTLGKTTDQICSERKTKKEKLEQKKADKAFNMAEKKEESMQFLRNLPSNRPTKITVRGEKNPVDSADTMAGKNSKKE